MENEALRLLNPHPRDARIEFQEEGHLYIVDGVAGRYTSVTTLIKSFFPVFDADRVISGMMASANWSRSKYHGKTADEIKETWEGHRDISSHLGTLLHAKIETYFNDLAAHGEKVVAPVPLEFGHFLEFYHDVVRGRLVPYRTEMRVFDEDVQIAGSVDMLFVEQDDATRVHLFDWKRSADIKKSNPYRSGFPPVEHLDDTNYEHYSLQLNVYRHILQTKYGLNVVRMAIAVFHPSNESYVVEEVRPMTEEVEAIWALRRTQ